MAYIIHKQLNNNVVYIHNLLTSQCSCVYFLSQNNSDKTKEPSWWYVNSSITCSIDSWAIFPFCKFWDMHCILEDHPKYRCRNGFIEIAKIAFMKFQYASEFGIPFLLSKSSVKASPCSTKKSRILCTRMH